MRCLSGGVVIDCLFHHAQGQCHLIVHRLPIVDGLKADQASALAATVAGHSLRAGFVTAADAAGAPISKVMEQARHARFETTRGYIREADAFRGNAASYLGL